MEMQKQIENAVDQICEAMQQRFQAQYPTLEPLVFKKEQGRKYLKLIVKGSVHAFIDADGNMYKPAGWQAPAKGIRFNVINDLPKLLQIATSNGGYLYVR